MYQDIINQVQREEAQLDVQSIMKYFDAYGFCKNTFYVNLLFKPQSDPTYVN